MAEQTPVDLEIERLERLIAARTNPDGTPTRGYKGNISLLKQNLATLKKQRGDSFKAL